MKNLNVHHLRYDDAFPWETPFEYLQTLCIWCHSKEHEDWDSIKHNH
jgi:hypothetical protein